MYDPHYIYHNLNNIYNCTCSCGMILCRSVAFKVQKVQSTEKVHKCVCGHGLQALVVQSDCRRKEPTEPAPSHAQGEGVCH